jgi:hypothetical protein
MQRTPLPVDRDVFVTTLEKAKATGRLIVRSCDNSGGSGGGSGG